MNCAPYAARNKDWSIGGALTELEQYNGLGYASRGVPSPYLWAGTNQYKSGKYVRDGVYDPHAVDSQPGCAGLLLAMMELDQLSVLRGHPLEPLRRHLCGGSPPDLLKPPPPSHCESVQGVDWVFIRFRSVCHLQQKEISHGDVSCMLSRSPPVTSPRFIRGRGSSCG